MGCLTFRDRDIRFMLLCIAGVFSIGGYFTPGSFIAGKHKNQQKKNTVPSNTMKNVSSKDHA